MKSTAQAESAGASDMFKHENDSVDKLLLEFNFDKAMHAAFHDSDHVPLAGSPVKPLNYKTPKELEALHLAEAPVEAGNIGLMDLQNPLKRDFNSSSDTCVSDINNDNAVPSNLPAASTETPHLPHAGNMSPSKSIMKTSTVSVSPKKTVVFQPSLDTFHTYTPKEPESASATELGTPAEHLWCETDQSVASQDHTLSPPAPPPHTSNTIAGLLTGPSETQTDADQDEFLGSLHAEYSRNSEKGSSNMSLSEKLNVYMASSSQENHDDLDSHLEQLGNATKEETDVNIHRLAHHLEEYRPNNVESPFNAKYKFLELYINSAHSSQSSLQSLVDSNRQLAADLVEKKSRGIQFNDGIRGFTDPVASLLIPLTTAEEDSLSESFSSGSHFSFLQMKSERMRNRSHSYDESYNLTEKSILNLLSSGTRLERSVGHDKMEDALENGAGAGFVERESSPDSHPQDHISEPLFGIKKERAETSVKLEQETGVAPVSATLKGHLPHIKTEPASGILACEVQAESSSVKPEPTNAFTPSFDLDKAASVKQEESDYSKVCEEKTDPDCWSLPDDHSLYDDFFGQEDQDPVAEMRKFQVDEKAVVPGPVKLVRSAEASPSFREMPKNRQLMESGKDNATSDDESRDMSPMKLYTQHHQATDKSTSADSLGSNAYEDSVEYLKSLAPNRPHAPKAASTSSHSKETLEKESDAKTPQRATNLHLTTRSSAAQDFDSSVLANSSNVSPPVYIKLPVVETDENEFADLTERLNESKSSFEEALSAEHDAEKGSLDFLSIWHSQLLGRRILKKPSRVFYKVPSILKYNTADFSQCEKYYIPASLQPKKFADVNLVSTRVVNQTFEEFHASALLPELSQDSGLGNCFGGIMNNDTTIDATQMLTPSSSMRLGRRGSLDSLNVLSVVERVKSLRNSSGFTNRRRQSINNTLRPKASTVIQPRDEPGTLEKKSRFHVPSFEIRRSISVLSPKNQYNDIFQDGPFVEPTIKAPGMKTLPSMDRDDVKKIMQMKQALSLEEYSQLKIVGALTVSATQHEPKNRHDKLQKQASIFCDSMASNSAAVASTFRVNPSTHSESLNLDPGSPRLRGSAQLCLPRGTDTKAHTQTLESKQNVTSYRPEIVAFDGNHAPHSPVVEAGFSGQVPLQEQELNVVRMDMSPQKTFVANQFAVDAKLPLKTKNVSPHNPFRTSTGPEGAKASAKGNTAVLPYKNVVHKFTVTSWGGSTPKQSPMGSPQKKQVKSGRNSPIKINSPLKMIKENGLVTGVYLDKKANEPVEMKELQNKKLRGEKTSLSTIPLNIMSDASSNTPISSNVSNEPLDELLEEPRIRLEESLKIKKPKERGKLFFRVVGLKNIIVPELKDRDVAFNLTLDNGIHCIRTLDYLVQANPVPIDKEFELSVSQSLEFIVTMKATYSKMKPGYKEVKERKVVKSKNKIGRLFGSKDIVTTTKFIPQEFMDPLENVFATDGSFARCYIDLDLYEHQISGKACNYDLICYNEWATYTHNGVKVVKNPYSIAQLEVKMLYVPRSEGFEILPTSIKSAYEGLDDLKSERALTLEGYLHQEGGDCETWKRRWFQLKGTSLVAHSEFSHKTRAKINLAKVAEVIYVDKQNIAQSSSNYRNFSDILLMANSFKIRFANGEYIDFGAPSKTEKALWIKTIQEIVYRNKFRYQPWVQMMQEKNGDSRKLWIGS